MMPVAATAAAPRRARHRSLCAGQEHGSGRRARIQALVERDSARPEPERHRRLSGGRRASQDYPDGASTALREAIGHAFGLDPDRIVCGAGSDDLLNLLADAYLRDGDEAIHTTHGFLVYPIATLGSGAKPVVAAEKNHTADVDAMLAAVSERTKVVFLANPNNPTGTYVPFDEVRRLHRGLPPHVLLVLDAAYAEYVRRNDYEAGIELVATSENVVMCAHSRKSTASPRFASAGCTGPPMWSMPSIAFAGHSTSTPPRRRLGSPR